MPLYFAYGSNLDIQQMQQHCAEAVPLVAPGCLQDYTLAFNKYASSWGGGVVVWSWHRARRSGGLSMTCC